MNDGDIAELWRPQTKKSFLIGVDEGIVLRADQPSLSAPIYGIWPQNTRFYYDAFYIADGYVLLVEQIRQAREFICQSDQTMATHRIHGDHLLVKATNSDKAEFVAFVHLAEILPKGISNGDCEARYFML